MNMFQSNKKNTSLNGVWISKDENKDMLETIFVEETSGDGEKAFYGAKNVRRGEISYSKQISKQELELKYSKASDKGQPSNKDLDQYIDATIPKNDKSITNITNDEDNKKIDYTRYVEPTNNLLLKEPKPINETKNINIIEDTLKSFIEILKNQGDSSEITISNLELKLNFDINKFKSMCNLTNATEHEKTNVLKEAIKQHISIELIYNRIIESIL